MPKGRFREKIKSAELAITFNDLIILPSHTSVEPSEVDVSTYVTMNYKLNIPFVSSPMDTVTGPEMAIALARQGGLGVLHRNCSAEEEVEMAKSKGFIEISLGENRLRTETAGIVAVHTVAIVNQ